MTLEELDKLLNKTGNKEYDLKIVILALTKRVQELEYYEAVRQKKLMENAHKENAE